MNKFENFDKQIYFIKIIIWDWCPLRCKYCFVDKEIWNVIDFETLKNFIDLLLYSPWINKLLHLLWWEPLLFFDIIKKWVLYARELASKLWKDLDISFCTSWLFFDEEKLDFINEQKIFLAWSIDWPENIHNLNRINVLWKWSFKDIITKKEIVVKNIKSSHLWIAMTIDENTAFNLSESYKYLVNLEKFNCTINIAPVDWKIWKKENEKMFVNELVKVYDYIFEEIWKWRFLYLNALNKEFRFNMLSTFRNKWRCLWFYTEAFSTWEILFNPFVNKEKDYSKFVVGNVNSESFMEDVKKYIWCKFDANSEKCNDCKKEYFSWMVDNSLDKVKFNKLLYYRDKISVLYANKIRLLAKENKFYKYYIDIAKEQMYV